MKIYILWVFEGDQWIPNAVTSRRETADHWINYIHARQKPSVVTIGLAESPDGCADYLGANEEGRELIEK